MHRPLLILLLLLSAWSLQNCRKADPELLEHRRAMWQADVAGRGRRLFSDPSLSGDGTRSCGTCHHPERAFTDGLRRSLALPGQKTIARNSRRGECLHRGHEPDLDESGADHRWRRGAESGHALHGITRQPKKAPAGPDAQSLWLSASRNW